MIRVNYNESGEQTFASGVASKLTLNGEYSADIYEIGLAGLADAKVSIDDDGIIGTDRVRIFGNEDDNFFLFRANQLGTQGVVASYEINRNLPQGAGGFIERVNYTKRYREYRGFRPEWC